MTKLVEHHIKYKEIHGYDETVWITQSEHKKLHSRLRKEGKCNVSVDELHKISTAAHGRTDKAKEFQKQYRRTPKRKEALKKYNKSEKRKETSKRYSRTENGQIHRKKNRQTDNAKEFQKQYAKQNIRQWTFYETLLPYVQHVEHIVYNEKTGSIYTTCIFSASRGKKIYNINEVLK